MKAGLGTKAKVQRKKAKLEPRIQHPASFRPPYLPSAISHLPSPPHFPIPVAAAGRRRITRASEVARACIGPPQGKPTPNPVWSAAGSAAPRRFAQRQPRAPTSKPKRSSHGGAATPPHLPLVGSKLPLCPIYKTTSASAVVAPRRLPLQPFNSSTLQLFNSSTLQLFNSSTLQLFNRRFQHQPFTACFPTCFSSLYASAGTGRRSQISPVHDITRSR